MYVFLSHQKKDMTLKLGIKRDEKIGKCIERDATPGKAKEDASMYHENMQGIMRMQNEPLWTPHGTCLMLHLCTHHHPHLILLHMGMSMSMCFSMTIHPVPPGIRLTTNGIKRTPSTCQVVFLLLLNIHYLTHRLYPSLHLQ